ncbi:hypothetical protein [Shimia ponticola]|uniref:hypothetical protein n=1 Tax=Shimia ponticola TaxID=2582893 RepID=UPI0011BEEF08|nr:hypothetical protein [Shimia ponticola]
MLRAFLFVLAMAGPAAAQQSEPPMDLPRMGEILAALDPEAEFNGRGFELTLSDVPVLIIVDPVADRMRAMVPIRSADGMTPEEMERVMQANFDTALDARYALARGRLWATYIHPLSPLKKDQLISGLGQTVNVALTYGTLYSGGAMSFGGGDSQDIQRQLIEDLLERGQDI